MLNVEADRAAASGDLARARSLLEQAVQQDETSAEVWLKLAAICRAQGDIKAALAGAEQLLKTEPLHFLALLLRANLLERAGSPEAPEAYGRAIAQRPAGELPPQVETMIAHGAERYRAFQEVSDRALSGAVERAELDLSPEEQERLERLRTNVSRLTRVFHCEPTDYHYPGLREREFHERSFFPWLDRLEAAADEIQAEFSAVAAAERTELVPYVQYPDGVPLRQWQQLNHNRDWSAIHLIKNGDVVEANARHCPRTLEVLGQIPQPHIAGVSPNAMFSLLAPGAHIPPHTGVANTRLVCHLPLIVPDGCWFRVGADKRFWKRGKAWVFDDTIEHEAKNGSQALRVILIIDVWHPDLNDGERAAVGVLMSERERLGLGNAGGVG